MRSRWPVLLWAAAGCGSAGGPAGGEHVAAWSLDLADPTGDVRLVHPPRPDLDRRTFDLERVTLERDSDTWRLEATFAAPVPVLTEVRAARDRVVAMVPMTVDVYLDTIPDAGHLAALPGRGFRVAASEAWDRVLVASSLPDLSEDDAVQAHQVTARGRRLVATFPASAVPGTPRGVLVVVLATAPSGTGRVRPVGVGGDCTVWEAERCTLEGDGPPVLDALATDVAPGRPLAMLYPAGDRPAVTATPVVFQRGTLLGAAPVDALLLEKGRLATILDASGAAIGTAVVLSVVGDTASLELVSPATLEGAAAVVFAAAPAREVTP